MLVLDADAVRAALPMATVVEAMSQVMADHARGQVEQPLRTHLDLPDGGGTTLVKPARLGGSDPAIGLKVVSIVPGNLDRGLPVLQGYVALLDPVTGAPQALMDGATITELRTGAVSAVATDRLATPDAGDLALLGAGVQARAHLAALDTVRQLRRVRVWSRSWERASALVGWAETRGWHVEAFHDVAEAVAGADIVCTVSGSPTPILRGSWLAPGCHVNAVGAFTATTRELASDVVAEADVIVVDSREGARAEAGDLLIPSAEGSLGPLEDLAELGEVVVGERSGRTASIQRTIFVSLGLAIQDIAAARAALRAARASRSGLIVRLGS